MRAPRKAEGQAPSVVYAEVETFLALAEIAPFLTLKRLEQTIHDLQLRWAARGDEQAVLPRSFRFPRELLCLQLADVAHAAAAGILEARLRVLRLASTSSNGALFDVDRFRSLFRSFIFSPLATLPLSRLTHHPRLVL